MIYTNNMSIVESKRFFSTCRQIVNNLILFFGLLGFTYLVFWFGGMTDYSIIERGETLFGPLATLIFPNSDAIDIYRNTGLISLALMLPVGFMYYVINKVENIIVHAIDKQNEIAAKKEKQQQFLDSLKEFDVIKSYSLCLSIDYESKKEFSQKNKTLINNAIFNKIDQAVKAQAREIYTSIKDVYILNSHDFQNYDKIYDTILNVLAEIKPKIENRYNVNLIPSITTDAHDTNTNVQKIKENHFGIQNCISKNRACTTEMFSKKYKHLNKQKYAGIPIGEYISSNKNTYELNIIHKNLSKTLASIS